MGHGPWMMGNVSSIARLPDEQVHRHSSFVATRDGSWLMRNGEIGVLLALTTTARFLILAVSRIVQYQQRKDSGDATGKCRRVNLSALAATALTLGLALGPFASLAEQASRKYQFPRDTVTIPAGRKTTLDGVVSGLAEKLKVLLTDDAKKEVIRIFSAAYPYITDEYLSNVGGRIDASLMTMSITCVKKLSRLHIVHEENYRVGLKTIKVHFSDGGGEGLGDDDPEETFGDHIVIYMDRIYKALQKTNLLDVELFARLVRESIVHGGAHTYVTEMVFKEQEQPSVAELLEELMSPPTVKPFITPSRNWRLIWRRYTVPQSRASIYWGCTTG